MKLAAFSDATGLRQFRSLSDCQNLTLWCSFIVHIIVATVGYWRGGIQKGPGVGNGGRWNKHNVGGRRQQFQRKLPTGCRCRRNHEMKTAAAICWTLCFLLFVLGMFALIVGPMLIESHEYSKSITHQDAKRDLEETHEYSITTLAASWCWAVLALLFTIVDKLGSKAPGVILFLVIQCSLAYADSNESAFIRPSPAQAVKERKAEREREHSRREDQFGRLEHDHVTKKPKQGPTDADYRRWLILGGSPASEARILGTFKGTLNLSKRNGKLVRIRLANLGRADRQFFEEWQRTQ